MLPASFLALAAAALFCVIRGVVDLIYKRYGWAAVSIAMAVGLMLVPIPTHAVKIDLLRAGAR